MFSPAACGQREGRVLLARTSKGGRAAEQVNEAAIGPDLIEFS